MPIGVADVYRYCWNHQGSRIYDGECVWLADFALRANRYRSFTTLGPVGPSANYVWGRLISVRDAGPGCIIQFRNIRFRPVYDPRTRITHIDGSIDHHTAVISRRVNADFEIFEQNYSLANGQRVRTVGRNMFHYSQAVSGYIWFYLPVH